MEFAVRQLFELRMDAADLVYFEILLLRIFIYMVKVDAAEVKGWPVNVRKLESDDANSVFLLFLGGVVRYAKVTAIVVWYVK